MQGLHPDVVSRLPQWHFTAPMYDITGYSSLPPTEQLSALQAVLQQLGSVLRAPHTTDVCWADGWQWDMAMADALVSAKAGLPHVAFSLRVSLTDSQVRPVVSMWPAVADVSVSTIELTPTHDDVVWPWDDVSIGWLRPQELVNFPRPAPGKTLTVVVCDTVEITDAVVQVRVRVTIV